MSYSDQSQNRDLLNEINDEGRDENVSERNAAARVGLEDQSAGVGATVDADHERMASGRPTTAGDPDAMQEQAKVVGEEAVGGTTPTPDQSNVDDIGTAVGVTPQPEHPINVVGKMRKRDQHRHELDPDSKERSPQA